MWRTALLLAALCVLYSSHYGRSQGRLQSYTCIALLAARLFNLAARSQGFIWILLQG